MCAHGSGSEAVTGEVPSSVELAIYGDLICHTPLWLPSKHTFVGKLPWHAPLVVQWVAVNDDAPTWTEWLLDVPLTIALILLGATVLTLLLRWMVNRVVRRLSKLSGSTHANRAQVAIGGQPQRLGQRLRTFQSVINSTLLGVIATVALLMILSELGVDVLPLIASAGIVGVALAFGAQSLVQDVVSGLFMLAEDQYGVGDRVELAGSMPFADGTVERVALRVTSLRDDDGRLWHVRNGEILRVANESQGWSVATAEIRITPDSSLTQATEVLNAATHEMLEESRWSKVVLDSPTVLVEDVAASYVLLRWSVRTVPGRQWEVASAFRHRLAAAMQKANLTLAD